MTLLTKPTITRLMNITDSKEEVSLSGRWIKVSREPQKEDREWAESVEAQITNVGLDLTLGCRRSPFDLNSKSQLQILNDGEDTSRYILVPAGHTISVETAEVLNLGFGIAALIKSKVRMVGQGFSHLSTTVDPGWVGPLLLTFTNQTAFPIRIPVGCRIATVVFFETSEVVHDRGDATITNNTSRWDDYLREARESGERMALLTHIITAVLVLLSLGLGYWYISTFFGDLWNEKKDAVSLEKLGWVAPLLLVLVSTAWNLIQKIPHFIRRHLLPVGSIGTNKKTL